VRLFKIFLLGADPLKERDKPPEKPGSPGRPRVE